MSISSILFEIAQGAIASPWSVLRLVISIAASTGVLKFISKFLSDSIMPTVTSFALGNIFGRLIDGALGYYVFNDGGSYMSGVIHLLNMLSVGMLTLSSAAGQLLPDGLVLILDKLITAFRSFLPESFISAVSSLCDQMTRFACLVETPEDFGKLLSAIEKAEANSQPAPTAALCKSSFFGQSVAQPVLDIVASSVVNNVETRLLRK